MKDDIIEEAVNDFISNREDILDYVKNFDDSFQAYIVSNEYACMNKEERASYVNSYQELKTFMFKLIEIKEILNHTDNAELSSTH